LKTGETESEIGDRKSEIYHLTTTGFSRLAVAQRRKPLPLNLKFQISDFRSPMLL